MADLGNDISCVEDLDPSLAVVDGRLALAQAIARRWLSPRGSLFYDPDYGAGLSEALNGFVEDLGELAARLEDEAVKDERVQSARVALEYEDEQLLVRGSITDAAGPFTLVLSTQDLTVGLLIQEG